MSDKRIYQLTQEDSIEDTHALAIDKSGQAEATYCTVSALLSKFQTDLELTEFISGLIESPEDGDYVILRNAPYAGTITSLSTKSSSGTCTLTGYVNTTALGGTANSVSSTEDIQSHSSSNTFSAGDDIKITVSSNSSCEDMEFTLKFTRALS